MPATARKPAARSPQPATRSTRNAQALKRAQTAHKTTKARTAPAAPRRKSGPVARPKTTTVKRAPAAPRVVASPIARVAQGGASVVLDGMLRGRTWVVIVGLLLAGIVFLNVSVLELNRGIAHTDAKAAALERKNSTLRERVAALDSTDRIQELAEQQGFVLPQPGEVTYVRPNVGRDAKLAATRIEERPELAEAEPAPTSAPVAATAPALTPPSAAPPSASPQVEPMSATAPAPVTATAPAPTP